ncbi:MAG: hypothetical protein ACRD3W_02805 [Terriglobales bacterium]
MNESEIHQEAQKIGALAQHHDQSGLEHELNSMPMADRIAVVRKLSDEREQLTNSQLPELIIKTGPYAAVGESNSTGVQIGIVDKPSLWEKAKLAVGAGEGDSDGVVHYLYKSTQKLTPTDPEFMRKSNF